MGVRIPAHAFRSPASTMPRRSKGFPGHSAEPAGSGRVVLERFLYPMQAYAAFYYLDAHGVPVTVQDPATRGAMGEIPFVEIASVLYLLDPEREEEARELLEEFRHGRTGVRGATWTCPDCGETHEPEFGACWNCGTLKP